MNYQDKLGACLDHILGWLEAKVGQPAAILCFGYLLSQRKMDSLHHLRSQKAQMVGCL